MSYQTFNIDEAGHCFQKEVSKRMYISKDVKSRALKLPRTACLILALGYNVAGVSHPYCC
jgi:hypothetical protein